MPKLTRNFLKGRMNKDVDLRLVPPGEYRDAANIQISTSEGADVGTVQSVLGNTKIQEKSSGVNWASNYGATSTPTVIGNVRDTQNNKIYFFITSNIDAIIEYDKATGYIAPVIIDARTSDPVLNFSTDNIITGANIIDGLLFFTDDLNEPRVINIADFKSATAATVATATTFAGNTTEIYGTNRLFTARDINVIKTGPTRKIIAKAYSSAIGAAQPTVAYPNGRFFGTGNRPITLDAQDFSTLGATVNITWSGSIAWTADTNSKVILRHEVEEESTGIITEYQIIGRATTLSTESATITIDSFSPNIPAGSVAWTMVRVEGDPIFENDFPRFSFRYKYTDGRYSTFAPFSEPVFIPGAFNYLSRNGFNEGMENNIRIIYLSNITSSGGTVGEIDPDVEEIQILCKSVSSNNIYVVKSIERKTDNALIDPYDITITKDTLGKVVESNQLLRLFDPVPRKAKAQEIIGNRVIYGNYLENYNVTDSDLTFTVNQINASHAANFIGEKSVKSGRKYQIGVSFLDEVGRESPVFTDETAVVSIDSENAFNTNSLTCALSGIPSWVNKYKLYVKNANAEYYNLGLDRYYNAEDGNVWLSFPSSERNKIIEGEHIFLKKGHNNNDPVSVDNKYKILSVSNEAPDNIKYVKTATASAEVVAWGLTNNPNNGFLVGDNVIKFYGPIEELIADTQHASPDSTVNTNFFRKFTQGNFISFSVSSNPTISEYYKIVEGGPIGSPILINGEYRTLYEIVLDKDIVSADTWLTNLTGAYSGANGDVFKVFISEERTRFLPEFEGKFFAKINPNATFTVNTKDAFSDPDDVEFIENGRIVIDQFIFSSASGYYVGWGDAGRPGGFGYDTLDSASNLFNLSEARIDGLSTNYPLKAHNFQKNFVAGATIKFRYSDGTESDNHYTIIAKTSLGQYARNNSAGTGETWSFQLDRNFNDTNPAAITAAGTGSGNEGSFSPSEDVTRIILYRVDSRTDRVINSSSNPAIFETEPQDIADVDIYYEATSALAGISNGSTSAFTIDWGNCFSFGNGVESDRIRDDFNAPIMGKGVRVSTILQEPFKEQRKKASLIFSGILNTRVGVNNTNQFIAAEKITKDLNPIYGSIQKLSARGAGARGDLLVLCEDKVFKVLANKDALFNADGNANLTASTNVLGQAIPFAGEYGISKNPESFASYGFRAYFADKARRAVLRLSADGLTVISDKGMRDFFSDHWDSYSDKLYAAFDERNEVYSIITDTDEQVSFNETVNGWPTRLTYSPDFSGVSLDNEYFTFKNGYIYIHNNNNKNSFYGGLAADSSINVIFNDAPDRAKTFKALSYDGVAGWDASITAKPSDQTGSITDWVEKEGFYYNYIKGTGTSANKDFNVQGIGQTNADIDAGNPITFANPININVQVNDVVYKENTATAAVVSAIAADRLSITPSIPLSANNGDFFHVVKPTSLFTNSVIGNAVLVNMTKAGGSTANNELFSVSAEVFISSE